MKKIMKKDDEGERQEGVRVVTTRDKYLYNYSSSSIHTNPVRGCASV